MASATAIEWTDASWNPVIGCSRISPGCVHCYAEVMAARLKAMALADLAAGRNPGRKRHYVEAIDEAGRWSGKLIPVPESLDDPLRWRKPRRVFVNSMSDLFHESVPFDFVDRVFVAMARCPQHTFQILTKRPARMAGYFLTMRASVRSGILDWPWSHVWLGTSVEDQQRADERVPWLLKCPAAVRFLSCEPLLGAIDLVNVRIGERDGRPHFADALFGVDQSTRPPTHCPAAPKIDWVIVGGESGTHSRECNLRWMRGLVGQCNDAGVPCFVKQLGSNPVFRHGELRTEIHGTPDGFRQDPPRDRKGGDPAEWPDDLRVRQSPEAISG